MKFPNRLKPYRCYIVFPLQICFEPCLIVPTANRTAHVKLWILENLYFLKTETPQNFLS